MVGTMAAVRVGADLDQDGDAHQHDGVAARDDRAFLPHVEDAEHQHQGQQHHGRAVHRAGDRVGAHDDGQRRQDLRQRHGRVVKTQVQARAQHHVPKQDVEQDDAAQALDVFQLHVADRPGVDLQEAAGDEHVGCHQRARDAQTLFAVCGQQQVVEA
jgi:hypothetical protein